MFYCQVPILQGSDHEVASPFCSWFWLFLALVCLWNQSLQLIGILILLNGIKCCSNLDLQVNPFKDLNICCIFVFWLLWRKEFRKGEKAKQNSSVTVEKCDQSPVIYVPAVRSWEDTTHLCGILSKDRAPRQSWEEYKPNPNWGTVNKISDQDCPTPAVLWKTRKAQKLSV